MTTIRCLLDESASISRHQPGIIQGDRIILFSEWNNLASAVADRLMKAGVGRGDRVSVFMANDWRLLVILAGIIRAGAMACPLSTRLPRVAVVERMREIGSRHIVAYLAGGDRSDLGDITVLSPDDLTSYPDDAAPEVPRIDLGEPAMIVFTSGSSGKPRPAVLSYGNLYYNARGANLNMRIRSQDRWLLNLPMNHVSGIGILFRCLMSGATVMIPEMKEALGSAMARYRPSHLSVVPAQLAELVDDPEATAFRGIKAILVGGDKVDPALVDQCHSKRWPVFRTYGMTEMGSQITTVPEAATPDQRRASSGRLLRHREAMVDDHGEILVRGPCLFMGYWTAEGIIQPVDEKGWFHTGDLGALDGEGFLHVLGRKDNLMISGGENIQPEEIELKLMSIPGVSMAVVVPVPHPKFGQRPVAFVKAELFDADELRAVLSRELPSFKVPDAFYPWPQELEQAGLKIQRSAFAAWAARKKR